MPTQDEVVQLPRTLDDWLTLLESRHPLGADGIELGLNRVAAIKLKLDQHETCPAYSGGWHQWQGIVLQRCWKVFDQCGLSRRSL